MKQVANNWHLSWRVVLLLLLITMTDQRVTSQPTDRNSTLMRLYCSMYRGMNAGYFLSNLNTTLSKLRQQLTTGGYANARTLFNGESVWGLAWCRGYLSIRDCLACYDYAVNQLKICELGSGAQIIYSDCEVRYERSNFYDEKLINRAGVVVCDNKTTSPDQEEFSKAAQKLLLDLQVAAPRAPKFYALSTRNVASGNATVYAIAQCDPNITQSVCLECLQLRTWSLYDCLPTVSGRAMNNGCFMRYDRTPFFRQNQTTDMTSLLRDGDSNKKRSIIGGVVGGVSFLLLVLAIFLWYRMSKIQGGSLQDRSTGLTKYLQGPTTYSYGDLKAATNNFSKHNKLGGGMFGEVYRGTLKDGDAVAINKIKMTSSGGNTHFNELTVMSNIVHHRHLVRLLGYCSKGPHLFLVHEYMENSSLDQFLFGDKATLNWKQRYSIIFGTAKGLAYLHEQYHVTIIHRDIKTSNILLDNKFQPKIANFGLIGLLPEEKTHHSTNLVESLNSGYVAPEYAIHGHLSEKVDTYSFGVVVLEIISGKRYKDTIDDNSVTQNLLDHAWNLYESGTHLNLMDEKLEPSEYETEDAKKIIEIALMCIQPMVSARPAMSEVVTFLSDKSVEERTPLRSIIGYGEVNFEVTTTSNATASTVHLSGR